MSGFWIRIDPVGHVVGSVYASVAGDRAEDAHKRFTPQVADRRREASDGYRHERVERAEWQRCARPCLLGECQHISDLRTERRRIAHINKQIAAERAPIRRSAWRTIRDHNPEEKPW